MREIAKDLKQNSSLEALNLDGTNIGAEGAREIAESLKQNSSLVKLNLGNNEIGIEGMREIAKCLKQNSSLEVLNLESTNIGAEGVREITESTSPALQSYTCKNPAILQLHWKIKDLHVHKILQLHCFYNCILKCYEFEFRLTKTLELFKL